MKISCPNCKATGTIPDHEIPEEGRFINCPRCKHGFDIKKPRHGNDSYLVETCPACYFSTFGDERFDTCPKCGVVVKTFIGRQREEQQRQREQELLTRKFTRDDAPPEQPEASPVAVLMENMHPVNLVGWGVIAASTIMLLWGLWGVLEYLNTNYLPETSDEFGITERPSGFTLFLCHGLLPWTQTLYGAIAIAAATLFLKHQAKGLQMLSWLLRAGMIIVPLYQIIELVRWVMQPVPHSLAGWGIEIFNVLFLSALICIPLFILDRFLQERKITSVVRL